MTDDDDLRDRLARLDPARRPPLAEAIVSRTAAQDIRERVMQTIDTAEPTTTPDAARPRRRLWAVAGAAAAVAAVVAGVALTTGGGAQAPERAPTTLTLKAGGDGTSMASCVPVEAQYMRDMPVAFGGTVTAVTGSTVTIDVDRWYRGGDADVVTLTNDTAANVSIDGVEFVPGERYLVTATDGTVNACGFSGPATPDLQRIFDEAFAG